MNKLDKGKWGCIKCGKNYYRKHNFISHWANHHSELMNNKLDEESHFRKVIKSNTEKVDNLIITDVDKWSLYNIWSIRQPLYMIEDTNHNDGIVLTIPQITELIITLQELIKKHLKEECKI